MYLIQILFAGEQTKEYQIMDDKTTTKKKSGRKPLPEGFSERRLMLSNEDEQRLNIILSIMYNDDEFKNMSVVDKTSRFFQESIKKQFNQYNEDGTLIKHFTSLGTQNQ